MTDSTRDELDQPLVLIVEDEPDLLELLRYSLLREGYRVATADTGEEGLRLARAQRPDLILLDLMLPAMDGLEVCRTLKSRPATANIPIIMLTARGEEADVVRGLEIGADDYIPKPFSPRVLMARLRAVLRRPTVEAAAPAGQPRVIEAGGVSLDPERHEVLVHGEPVTLTATEFRLLALFAARPGRVFTRQQIIESIHDGMAAVTDRSVDVLVLNLRRKLGEVGASVQTVRGIGYRFKE